MAKAKAQAKARPKKMATGWPGFAGRLRYALGERQREDPGLTQNSVAERAGIDSGQFAKILSGERALGLTANTALLLADALSVRPIWLLTGQEPSGLVREPSIAPVPPPSAPPSSPAESLRPVSSGRR